MKVLIINGSPRVNGNTTIAIREMEQVFAENGVSPADTVQRPENAYLMMWSMSWHRSLRQQTVW